MEEFYNALKSNDMKKALKVYQRIFSDYENFTRAFKKYAKSIEGKSYYYLVTFTLDKTKEKTIKNLNSEGGLVEIEKYIISQFQRPPLQVKKAYIVQEETKNGDPHWHVSVKTGTCLKKDRFNYYQKIYGYVDISKTRHKSMEESLNYISKSNTPTEIIIERN